MLSLPQPRTAPQHRSQPQLPGTRLPSFRRYAAPSPTNPTSQPILRQNTAVSRLVVPEELNPEDRVLHISVPAISVTRQPRDGWPRVHQRSFTSWSNGQSVRQVEAWTQQEGPLAVIQFAGHGAQDVGTESRIEAAQSVLRANYDIDTDNLRFVAAIPQAGGQHHDNALPTYIAVFSLASGDRRYLASRGWISTPNVTFRIETVNTSPPTFIGAFTQARRFGSLNPSAIAERIRETIHDDTEVLWDMYEIISRDASAQGRWALSEPDLILEHIIDTV